jgi:hypothetical protein
MGNKKCAPKKGAHFVQAGDRYSYPWERNTRAIIHAYLRLSRAIFLMFGLPGDLIEQGSHLGLAQMLYDQNG